MNVNTSTGAKLNTVVLLKEERGSMGDVVWFES